MTHNLPYLIKLDGNQFVVMRVAGSQYGESVVGEYSGIRHDDYFEARSELVRALGFDPNETEPENWK